MGIFNNINILLNTKQWVKIYLIFFIILFLSAFQMIPPVYAETNTSPQSFNVSPAIINVPLSPGKKYSYAITITNLSNKPLLLQASLKDFQTTGEEGDYLLEDTHTNPLLSWLTLSKDTLILNPHEKKKINLMINTPKNIPLGGYYGILFFEPVLQNMDSGKTRIIPQVGILLLANIGVPDPNAKQADILTFTTGLFHQTNSFPLLLRVKNISLHFFTAKPILTISPLISFKPTPVSPMYLDDRIIFQDKVRRWEEMITLPDNHPNIYKVNLAVSTGNGNYSTESTYLVVFPFANALLLLLLCIVIAFLIKRRKRLKGAFKALFHNT